MTVKVTTDFLVGMTVSAVVQDESEIVFTLQNGWQMVFYHQQDCCEEVYVEDVNGDWDDIIGVPMLVAEERTSQTNEGYIDVKNNESATWTFYTFRTINGSVDVRWGGYSNGCYSESVDIKMRMGDQS